MKDLNCHNPYFTGNSFAITLSTSMTHSMQWCHNPYFTGNSFAINYYNCYSYGGSESQSLFYWKLLCNEVSNMRGIKKKSVTILILLETPLQYDSWKIYFTEKNVTILILLETPLQSEVIEVMELLGLSHNPYFTGNSFAINVKDVTLASSIWVTILILLETPLQ